MMGKVCHGNVTTVRVDPRPGPEEAEINEFLALSATHFPDDAVDLSMQQMRERYDGMCRAFHAGRPDGMAVRDSSCAGPGGAIALRHYVPANRRDGAGLIYLHGGGYVLGGLDSHDDICCGLAEMARVTVIAVDYRLAPEHRFPAAFDDSAAAVEHILSEAARFGIDANRTVIAGDSAGGNLAAAVCLKRRDDGLALPSGQVLIYPSLGGDMTRGSYISRANAPGLTTASMRAYDRWYMGDAPPGVCSAKFHAPLRETDYAGLPPAFLVACEWDPLRDDCFDYADRLQTEGIAVQVRHEPEMVHACLRARHMSPAAGAMFAAIAAAVQRFSS
jgi:acetyl esterase